VISISNPKDLPRIVLLPIYQSEVIAVKKESCDRTFYFYSMSIDELKHYIEDKLVALKKEKDMNEVTNEGKLSFGMQQKDYKHLPSWNDLVKNKKKLVRVFWVNCFLVSFVVVGFCHSFEGNFEQNWIRAVSSWVLLSLTSTILYVAGFYFSLFYQVRKTEREVRKLIYEDILDKMNRTGSQPS
jgi:hypothetical protein